MATYKITTEPTSEPLSLTEAKAHLYVDSTDHDTLISALITAVRQSVESFTWRALCNQQQTKYFDYTEASQAFLLITKGPVVSIDSVKYVDSTGALQTLSTDDYESDVISEPARIRITGMPQVKDVMNCLQVNFTCGYTQTSGSAVASDSVNLTTNIITKTAHGLYNGQILRFTALGTVTGLSTGLQYYVRDSTTDTFKVCLVPGGTAVDLTGTSVTPPTYQLYASAVPEAIKSAMKLQIGHLFEHREDVIVGAGNQTLEQSSKYLLEPYRIAAYQS